MVFSISNLRNDGANHLDDSIIIRNDKRITGFKAVGRAVRTNSCLRVSCIDIIGTLGGGSNLMTIFFEYILIGSIEEKVEVFKDLANKNKILEDLIEEKDARIDEYNLILEFLEELTNEEV